MTNEGMRAIGHVMGNVMAGVMLMVLGALFVLAHTMPDWWKQQDVFFRRIMLPLLLLACFMILLTA